MNKVAIYLRLSEEDKNKVHESDDSESIKNQRLLLLSEIKKHPDFILYDEYCDEDISGAGSYRPEFERLIKDCENGLIDVVLCKSQSRFSRDMEIIEKYLHNKFIEWNIRFISIADNADTQIESNKKARQINGLINEWYLEDISNNIKSAFKAKMLHGELISPFAPYGYLINPSDNNKLIIDKNVSSVVKQIYKYYQAGYGFQKIANILNSQKIPSPSFYKYSQGSKLNIISEKNREDILWSGTTIKRILTNEVYIGNLVQGKRTTVSYKNHKIKKKDQSLWIKSQNAHDKIISKKLFYEVQKLIQSKTQPRKEKNYNHPLANVIYCQHCGSLLKRKSSPKYQYLVCSQAQINKNPCNKGIRYDLVQELIMEKIQEIIPGALKFKPTKNTINALIKKIEIDTTLQKLTIYWRC